MTGVRRREMSAHPPPVADHLRWRWSSSARAARSSPTTASSARRRRRYFASDEDHFLFGSIGTEASEGVPYWIWLVLPRIFPDLLPGPGGYASLGIAPEATTRCRSVSRR